MPRVAARYARNNRFSSWFEVAQSGPVQVGNVRGGRAAIHVKMSALAPCTVECRARSCGAAPPIEPMMSRVRLAGLLAFGISSLVLASCGGETSSESGSGASAGAGGGGAAGASGGSGAGGSGAAPAGGGAGCGPTDPGGACSALGEVGCLAAHPRCAPVYDDYCCPSCDPTGACADCVDYRFHRCAPIEETSCVPGTLPVCGNTPSWACQGGSASCSNGQPCNFTPGCIDAVVAGCGPDAYCPPECHPTSAWTCGPMCTAGPLPICDDGVPEYGPNGATGYCMRAGVCAGAGACPDAPPAHGAACSSPGKVCTYSGFCAPSCSCEDGAWSCATPPC
jgi:hypothetical protein